MSIIERVSGGIRARLEENRVQQEIAWEQEQSRKWESLFKMKKRQAGDLPLRFTTAYGRPKNGFYCTLVEADGAKIAIIDRDKKNGGGERFAVVRLETGVLVCLETERRLTDNDEDDKDNKEKDPHNWTIVKKERRKEFLEDAHKRVFESPHFNSGGNTFWRGHFPNTEEIMEATCKDRYQI